MASVSERPRDTSPTMRRVRRPRLYTAAGEGERHISWLELFFDLVFVIAVAELAHLLHDDHSLGGIAVYAALFVPVWWQWIDFSYYADQFETDTTSANLVTLFVMFGVLVMALSIHDVPHGYSWRFGAIIAALRAVILALYVWAWRTVPESRELTARYSLSFAIALAIWVVALFAPEPARFVLWGIALLIEIGNGPVAYATIKNVPAQRSHMDERFGLFLIIVLGEAVLAVATGVADTEWRWPAIITAAGGFAVAAGMWWLYFVRADASVINRALRSDRRGLLLSYLYGYSHLIVFAAIAATGIGIEFAIHAAPAALSAFTERLVLAGGLAAFLAGVTLVQWAAPQGLPRPVVVARLLAVLACLALVAVGGAFAAPPLVMALVALLVGLALVEHRAG